MASLFRRPNDRNNAGDGTTPFTRSFWSSETVTLTAPASVGDNPFRYWLVDGTQLPNTTVNFSTSTATTAEAVYWNFLRGSSRQFGRAGCRGSHGLVPSHTISHDNGVLGPLLDTPVRFDASGGLPGGAGACLIGFNPQRLHLLPFGAPGCYLNHHFLDSIGVAFDGGGTATIEQNYPWVPALVGGRVRTTYVVFDPAANNLGLILSNSVATTFGGRRE